MRSAVIDEHQQRHRTAGRPGENIDAPHGGEPVVFQAHQPVERAEGEREGQKAASRCEGDLAHREASERRIAIPILLRPKACATDKRDAAESRRKETPRG